MEIVVKASWVALALVHAAPASAFFAPHTLRRLYGIEPDGDLGVLMTHRAALFLALVALALFAVFDSSVRRAASVVIAVSVLGFLAVYGRAGFPEGALRKIALVDAAALLPLTLVLVTAWRSTSAR